MTTYYNDDGDGKLRISDKYLIGYTCPNFNYTITRVDDPEGDLWDVDNYNLPVQCPKCEETTKLNYWKLRLRKQ